MTLFSTLAAVLVFGVFNVPVVLVLWKLSSVDLGEVLKEKSPAGGPTDTTSYSRVTGLVGAAILTAFFWAIGDVALYKAFTQIADIKVIVDGVSRLFMVGAALFLPYAFNQIKSAFGAAQAAKLQTVGGGVQAPPPAASLNLLVANLSTSIDDAAFAAAVAAVSVQVSRDFQPEWGSAASLRAARLALTGAEANVDGSVDAVIYVGETAKDPTLGMSGVYGYHALNFGKTPYAFVYLDVCAQYGEAWSNTLSHEVLELLADPTTAVIVTGPAPPGVGALGQTVGFDLEVCDPTQGDSYKINGITVSNFVTRRYFGLTGASAATNFLNLALSPFGVRPGGYIQYEDSSGVQQINGGKVDAKRLAARATLDGHRRNARRAEGLRLRV
jgi:hypothetical protein